MVHSVKPILIVRKQIFIPSEHIHKVGHVYLLISHFILSKLFPKILFWHDNVEESNNNVFVCGESQTDKVLNNFLDFQLSVTVVIPKLEQEFSENA